MDTQCSFGSTVKSQEAKDRETVYVAGVGGGGSHTCFEVLLFSAEAGPSFSVACLLLRRVFVCVPSPLGKGEFKGTEPPCEVKRKQKNILDYECTNEEGTENTVFGRVKRLTHRL